MTIGCSLPSNWFGIGIDRLAGHCEERLWQPRRDLHRLEQSHVGWQRVCTFANLFFIRASADYARSVALLSPLVLIAVLTLVFGHQHYDWKSMMQIRQGDDHDLATAAHLDLENTPGGHVETANEFEAEQKKLLRAGKISKTMTVVLT